MMINLVLVHYPCVDKNHDTVATAAFPLDVQDIARSCATFGVKRFFVVHPEPRQREFLQSVVDFWAKEEARQWNESRSVALELVEILPSLEALLEKISNPLLVTTSASLNPEKNIIFSDLKKITSDPDREILLILGTGYGLHKSVFEQSALQLEPIYGASNYNHLSVRSAAAIILSRLI
ncbi:MAG: RNA methyltransferase [Candidatus Wallbacteria bacterium]|nr:RNA methyltransferase [Candidatus Wallbacteria bacterium]